MKTYDEERNILIAETPDSAAGWQADLLTQYNLLLAYWTAAPPANSSTTMRTQWRATLCGPQWDYSTIYGTGPVLTWVQAWHAGMTFGMTACPP